MPNPDQKIWLDVLSYLRSSHPDMCRQWFEDLQPLGVAEGVFRVRVHQPVHLRYLAKQCADRFTEAVQSVTGRLVPVRFVGAEEELGTVVTRPLNGAAAVGHVNGASGSVGSAHEMGAGAMVVSPGAGGAGGAVGGTGGGAGGGGASRASSGFEAKPTAVRSGATPPTTAGRYDSMVLNPDYNFEHFIVGPENRLAHAAALAVSGNPGRTYNPLFVHGGVGLGKTHLLQAMCLRLMAERPGISIYYTSCEAFNNQYFEAVQLGLMSEFHHRFRGVDVLIVDDIHYLTKRDRTQEEFFHTFNDLYHNGKQLVLSSDAAPSDIPALEERLVSRFQSGLVVQVSPPGYDTRVQIIKQKAKLREIEMPDDVACLIAGRGASNIRELEGAITKVQMLAAADRVPISLELARQAIGGGPIGAGGSRPEVTITNIIDAVMDHYGVKLSDLQSKRRQKSIAHPRQVCMYLARRMTRYSLEEIGGYFGGRDHTTVMHAVRTIEERRDGDPEQARVLAALEVRLGGTVRE
ncbi:MAG: chromosomal replication initiator protein DnaA [Phycisphaerales bacterium]